MKSGRYLLWVTCVAFSITAAANEFTGHVQYVWTDSLGVTRFSTAETPPATDACLSNFGQFILSTSTVDPNNKQDLAKIIDAKVNSSHTVTIVYTIRPSTRDCDNSNADDLLASVLNITLH